VLDLDAGDLGKGLRQRLGLVFVGRDGFRDDVDVHALEGTAALMSHCISFIWSSLERVDGWNSLSIHFFAGGLIGARGHGDRGRDGDQRKRAGHHQIRVLEGPLNYF